MHRVIPKYYGLVQWNGNSFLELEDVLTTFSDIQKVSVMDLKLGVRTFLESEVHNKVGT